MTEKLPAVIEPSDITSFGDMVMPVEQIIRQIDAVQQIMKRCMQVGLHYGKIPGCPKPSLLQPGAEKLCLAFHLGDTYEITQTDLPNGHREYLAKCIIVYMPTGQVISESVGVCSTLESKYRYRKAGQKCPECGKEDTIIKGKKEYIDIDGLGAWLCFTKKKGCGAKFKAGDERIENQMMGKVEHEDPADYYNTCCKIAQKRAMVSAVRSALAASDIFYVDIEENPSQFGFDEPTAPPPQQPTYDAPPPYDTPEADLHRRAEPIDEPSPPQGPELPEQPPIVGEMPDTRIDSMRTMFKAFLGIPVDQDKLSAKQTEDAGNLLLSYMSNNKVPGRACKRLSTLKPEQTDVLYPIVMADYNKLMLKQEKEQEAEKKPTPDPGAKDNYDLQF